MLDNTTLSQLSQLKTNIQASKEYAEGTVAGTNGRFGFVRLEDGRDAFLSPEKMQRVIPGDRVKVSLKQNSKNQLEGDLETVLEQSLTRFLGQYRVTKKGHFVVPLGDAPGMKSSPINRWIFLPPKGRSRCKDGDMVVAKLLEHPFKDGKASAKILERIGSESDAYIERKYTIAKYDLQPRLNENAQNQTTAIEKAITSKSFGEGRTDLTNLTFVTIDAASTRDMDDALYLEKKVIEGVEQYHLKVAIADPAFFITQKSSLAQSAQKNGQSLYMLGGGVPMLPDSLANDCFSLKAEEERPALVCSQVFDAEGKLLEYHFEKAVIRSHFKLSYIDVTALLEGDSDNEINQLPADTQQMLNNLGEFTERRTRIRKKDFLVGEDQLEYDIQLSNTGKIDKLSPRTRTRAHKIVEEAMLATNLCAGEFLQKHNTGLFTSHSGFREDRLGEVKALLKEESVEHPENLLEADSYIALIKSLMASDKAHLVSPLRRMMPSSELSLAATPHLGMGMPVYATVTSPIRRYADLYNHWAISQLLTDSAFTPITTENLAAVKSALQQSRQADRELYQWLICQYAQKFVGTSGKAKVRIVTQQGFGARLIDSGVDGFVLFPKKQEKTFDAKRMTITTQGNTYALENDVEVKIESVDMEKRRIAFSVIGPEAD
ncbi:VacB/RNase II family 3'-5' exoribonuclease [Teredinibacter franksiae]|uniref:VacB/RNase II family 3'-5' exoribonuclease n=1 Tax=Teredinibacter franksiae TaxID=2761453 RepID=UPI00162694F9|nr:VacB/RNase II family 3'-5' exoribonuclease [Teredinibacter franksiae]